FNRFSIEFSNLGTIPNENNNPPKLKAKITIPIVNNILFIPPRVNNVSICSFPVSDTYPPNNVINTLPIGCGLVKIEIIKAVNDPALKAKNAGTFLIDNNKRTAIGMTAAYQLIKHVSAKLY